MDIVSTVLRLIPDWLCLVVLVALAIAGGIVKEWEREQRRKAWWAWYNAYLQSPAWRQRRAEVLQRDHYTCQQCHHARARHVHHLTYDRVGNEHPSDLLSLCEPCHQAIHGR